MHSISFYMVSGFQKDIKENIPSKNWTHTPWQFGALIDTPRVSHFCRIQVDLGPIFKTISGLKLLQVILAIN